jgi:hypothetical protein
MVDRVREAMNAREERAGQSTAMLVVWRQGGARSVVIPSFGAMKLCFEVQDGQYG